MAKSGEIRGRLIAVAVDMLSQEVDPEAITLREIGRRAGVAHGLVNYYFGSKDALLSEAVSVLMNRVIDEVLPSESASPEDPNALDACDPLGQIRAILVRNAEIGARYDALLRYMIRDDLRHGGWGVIQRLLPPLRTLFGRTKSEPELLILASQIVLPIQIHFLHPYLIRDRAGLDPTSASDREWLIDRILQNVLG